MNVQLLDTRDVVGKKAKELGLGMPEEGEALVGGKVVDASTREPLAGVLVRLNDRYVAYTDADGYYVFMEYIPYGTYTLTGSLPGYSTHTQSLVVAEWIVVKDFLLAPVLVDTWWWSIALVGGLAAAVIVGGVITYQELARR